MHSLVYRATAPGQEQEREQGCAAHRQDQQAEHHPGGGTADEPQSQAEPGLYSCHCKVTSHALH